MRRLRRTVRDLVDSWPKLSPDRTRRRTDAYARRHIDRYGQRYNNRCSVDSGATKRISDELSAMRRRILARRYYLASSRYNATPLCHTSVTHCFIAVPGTVPYPLPDNICSAPESFSLAGQASTHSIEPISNRPVFLITSSKQEQKRKCIEAE